MVYVGRVMATANARWHADNHEPEFVTLTTHLNATSERIAGPDRVRGELLDVKSVAAMLDCSARHVYRLADGGKMPRPLKLGALVRWRAAEIRNWIDCGCPNARSMKGGAK